MSPDYIGTAVKWANTPREALDCMAKKSGKYSKKTKTVVDSKENTLTILSIHEEKDT